MSEMVLAFGVVAVLMVVLWFVYIRLVRKGVILLPHDVLKSKRTGPPCIEGVCLGWDMKPHLSFSDGTYLHGKAERIFYPEYFPDDVEWPIDPQTGEQLPIVDDEIRARYE